MSPSTYTADVQARALTVLGEQLSWVPTGLKGSVQKTAVYSAGVLTVTVSLPSSALSAVLPVLVLPGNIRVPSLPTTLTAQSSLQF